MILQDGIYYYADSPTDSVVTSGAFAYFIIFAFYFGNDLYNQFTGTMDIQALLIDFVGIILPLISLIDIAVNKDRMRK